MTMCVGNCKLGTAAVVGVSFSLFGSICFVYWPTIFDALLNHGLALTPHSKSFELWEVTPIPVYINFYFFNWTNSASFKSKNYSKPILQELGPYVFREQRSKVVLDFDDKENYTITYLQNRTWIFEPTLSNGSLDDIITTINTPAISAVFAIRKESGLIKQMLNLAMRAIGTKLVIRRKARELLFEGYNDPLMDLGSILPEGMVSVKLPFDKFGWFYSRNQSADFDGTFKMSTGRDDIAKFGELVEWNHEKNTSYYPSYCGHVNGSAGEFFPPKRDKTSISLYSSEICRTVTLNYKEEVQVEGINGYRYWGDENMFANKTKIPDNWCFCVSEECPPHGAVDVSTCKWGAPAYVSYPHFYQADPYYRESVIGMKPDEDKHQMFIDMEPRTGAPLRVAAALQVNILLRPWEEYTLFRNVPKIYFPTFWFTQTVQISKELVPQVKLLTMLPYAGSIACVVLLSIGVTIILITGMYQIANWHKDADSKYLKSMLNGMPDSKMKSSLLSAFSVRVMSTSRLWGTKLQPDSIVTIQNGTQVIRYSIPRSSEENFNNPSAVRLSQVSHLKIKDEELSPLRND